MSTLEELRLMANHLSVNDLRKLVGNLKALPKSEDHRLSVVEKEEFISYCKERADFTEQKIESFGYKISKMLSRR
ncbi:MAG: hypothetical protein AABW67_03960 [Nanoarchaeota archaeon]